MESERVPNRLTSAPSAHQKALETHPGGCAFVTVTSSRRQGFHGVAIAPSARSRTFGSFSVWGCERMSLPRPFTHGFVCGWNFSFLWNKCSEMQLLGFKARAHFVVQGAAERLSRVAVSFYIQQQRPSDPISLYFRQHSALSPFFPCSDRWGVISHHGSALCFPNDTRC